MASPVASRPKLLAEHARLAWAEHRADPDDFTPKRTTVLGMTVSFFNWRCLHYLFDEVFLHSCYAFESSTRAPRIIDAGANIGLASLWLSEVFPDAEVIAVEPDPATFSLLETNLHENDRSRVEAVAAALTSRSGTTELMVDPARPGNLHQSLDPARMDGAAVEVPAVALSELIDGPVDLLKLDVEGAEHDVITELVSSGALSQVKALAMEYHHHIDPEVERFGEMLSMLEAAGFSYRVSSSEKTIPTSRTDIANFQDIFVQAVRR
jgi:FkbM family methyltransferase